MIPQSIQILLGICLFLVLASGCHSPLALKQMQAKNPLAKNAPKTPVEIVDAWNSYAQATPDGKMIRGMAGRVHFFDDKKKNQAVKVDGNLTVFVFDAKEMDPARSKPLKVFRFRSDTLEQYYSYQTPLGHGYNLFLPMDEIGGEEKPLYMITRFDNVLEDMFLVAQPVNSILVGRRPQTPTDPSIREFLDSRSLLAEANRNMVSQFDMAAQHSPIQQAGHLVDGINAEPAASRVTRIPLDNGMTRRLLEPSSSRE